MSVEAALKQIKAKRSRAFDSLNDYAHDALANVLDLSARELKVLIKVSRLLADMEKLK